MASGAGAMRGSMPHLQAFSLGTYYVLELKPQHPIPTTMAKGWQSSVALMRKLRLRKVQIHSLLQPRGPTLCSRATKNMVAN